MEAPDANWPQRTIVPLERVSADALAGLIDDFVTREGTDYGQQEYSLESKRADVRRQLEVGQAVIVFDHQTESVTLVSREELRRGGEP